MKVKESEGYTHESEILCRRKHKEGPYKALEPSIIWVIEHVV